MQPYQPETIRLMARFRIQVRRLLNQSVDLEQLATDPNYARLRFAELEAVIQDEDLMAILIQLRAQLLNGDTNAASHAKPAPSAVANAPPTEANPAPRKDKYLRGPRG
jgi:hypothetical protein